MNEVLFRKLERLKEEVVYLVSVYKLRIKLYVIPRLDRGIHYFQWFMDPPVKPEDDKIRLYGQTLFIDGPYFNPTL